MTETTAIRARLHRCGAASRALVATAALVLVGCAGPRALMPTPSVYALGIEQPFNESLPSALRSGDAELIYATDRVATPREDGRLDYGVGRDPALIVGEAVVNIGGGASWAELVEDARSDTRARALHLEVTSVTERIRSPEFPVPYAIVDGLPVMDEQARSELSVAAEALHRMLRDRLATAPRKEILLFVHGVANTFDDALFTTAELWHYLGREFVPVVYTWPAGQGGALRGYSYDRESSEYTVFHFKRFLAWLSTLPEVEGIHIIAHSRGTDVVATGLRELMIASVAAGIPPEPRFKMRNVVMAAPDINLDVALQRTSTESVDATARRWTFYSSPHDKAIGISEFLFGGGGRIGTARYENLNQLMHARADYLATTFVDREAIVEYAGRSGGAHGHDYFRTNPAVSSDLVLTVRFGRRPGAEHGRPLERRGPIFWEIDDDYPRPAAAR